MKAIHAVIRPNKLKALQEALRRLPTFPGMTVTKAEGCSGNQRRHAYSTQLFADLTDFMPKLQITIISPDEHAQTLYDSIIHTASTGLIGDGLVWMSEIERASFIFRGGTGTSAP